MIQPVYDRQGKKSGPVDGEKFLFPGGPAWIIVDGNVYENVDAGVTSFMGHFRGAHLVGFAGELVASVGTPPADLKPNNETAE
jgi:hypothetical protein